MQLTIKQALSQAKKAIKKGDTAVAVKLYKTILHTQPNNPTAQKGLKKLQKNVKSNSPIQGTTTNPPQGKINAALDLYYSGELIKTERMCRELLQTFPQSFTVLNLLSAALQGQGRLQESVKGYEKLIQIKPDYEEAYYNRGVVLKKLGLLDEAIKSYEQAIKLKPDYAEAYSNLGNVIKELGFLDQAVKNYEKAIQLKPDYTEAYYNLGNALQGLGLQDKAEISYKNAIQIKPDYAKAYRSLGAIHKYKSGDKTIIVMKELYAQENLKQSDRIHLSFALAKVYEDFGEYDRAFKYLLEGNCLRKKELNYTISESRILFTRIRQTFIAGKQSLNFTQNKGGTIEPVFIVGMPRSGTTLVEQILASHSKIYGAGELKAMNKLVGQIIYSPSRKNSTPQINQISQGEIKVVYEGYLNALTALKVPEMIITDKMPTNFLWIGFILSAFPDAKIIHLNRDSKATCWSIYKHYFSSKGNGYAYSMEDTAEFYLRYKDLMRFWREKFPNKIYDISYEKLVENQEEETRKLLDYCDLEWDDNCLNFHKTDRVVETASLQQVRKQMYKGSNEAWKKYEQYLQPMIKILNEGLKNPAEYLEKLDKASSAKVRLVKPTLPSDIY